MSTTIWRIFLSLILGLGATICFADCNELFEFAARNATKTPDLPPYFKYVPDTHNACLQIGARAGLGNHIDGCADPFGKQMVGYCLVILPLDVERNPVNVDKCHEIAHCKYGYWHN